jgi:glutathione S-transferase
MSDTRTLYQLWLSPFCRKVRLALAEKKLDFILEVEKTWERRRDFLKLNPSGEVPVLVDIDGLVVADSQNICDYLDEKYTDLNLTGVSMAERVEVRRLTAWFDRKFNNEVTDYLVGEKIMKRLLRSGTPDGQKIRAGHANIHYHLDYIGYLADKHKWLAGERLTLADLAAAAHLSTIDYLGDVPWDQHKGARDWYMRLKSRPSFRQLLTEQIPGTTPAVHYADLDF